MKEKIVTEREIRNKTLIAFAVFILFICSCVIFWKWLNDQPKEENALKPLRKGLYMNEAVFSRLYSFNNISRPYSKKEAASRVRVNGFTGLRTPIDTTTWKLRIIRPNGDTLFLGIDEIKTLPKTEVIFDFKCIEGWNQVSHWAGVRYSDLIQKYGLQKGAAFLYTGLETPDKQYYVGVDNASMMHPQTILAYEMNEKPLLPSHGHPLRLIIPVKYGVKHLKRIGTIFFSNTRPRDYWFERGYDYYCGL